MISVMDDKSFANLEKILQQKRSTILLQIDNLTAKLGELDEFLETGREND